MHKFLSMAIDLAREHVYDDDLDYHLCSIIVRGGSVVSVGFNKRSRNGFVDYVAERDTTPRPHLNTHAEMAAILAARAKIDLCGSKLFVARVKPTGVGMARPCDACQFACSMHGIRKLTYTISESEWGVLKLRNDHGHA